MDTDRLVSGEKAIAVWREMAELKEKAKRAYCARRRLEVPEDIPFCDLGLEWFSVTAAFAGWCKKAYQVGRLAENPQNAIAYHFLIGSTPLWSERMNPDMDGEFSAKKWLRQVVETSNHFMPPDALKMYNAEEAYWRRQEAAKVALEPPPIQREEETVVIRRGDTLIIRLGPYSEPTRPGVLAAAKSFFRRVTGRNTSEM